LRVERFFDIKAMESMKPLASLSLDLDNEWAYLRTHGYNAWQTWPSYLNTVVPRILDFLAERHLKITFFIVGRDAANPAHREVMEAIAAAGHEIANHSFEHHLWLHLYSEKDLENEIVRAENAIESATGCRPLGFRGPGYSFSIDSLRLVARRGYRYDATLIPNILHRVARSYVFATGRLTKKEKDERKALLGQASDAFRPLKPFEWKIDDISLLEIPVTTLPLLRVPFHFSYLHFLSELSPMAARAYFRTALALCQARRIAPSLLLHPPDFLGREDSPSLSFFPGMKVDRARKLERTAAFVDELRARFRIVTMREHAGEVEAHADVRALSPQALTR
jgi:peptidoglycan/xylan/chitin deacetylase (PgdA/CDA1 family)